MKIISSVVILSLLVVVVIYAVVNKHDISIETPIASVTSTAQKAAVISNKPSDMLPATYMLKEITSYKPQEKNFVDKVYLKVGDTIFTDEEEIRIGESIRVNKPVKAGTLVSLWEMDGFLKDGDDDFLGMATVQGAGGVLKFENPAVGDHSYELSYELVR